MKKQSTQLITIGLLTIAGISLSLSSSAQSLKEKYHHYCVYNNLDNKGATLIVYEGKGLDHTVGKNPYCSSKRKISVGITVRPGWNQNCLFYSLKITPSMWGPNFDQYPQIHVNMDSAYLTTYTNGITNNKQLPSTTQTPGQGEC